MDEKKMNEIILKMLNHRRLPVEEVEEIPSYIINKKGMFDLTLLTVSSQTQSLEIVHALLKKGADVNGQNVSGWTPLMAAIKAETKTEEEIYDMVEFLLENNANPNIQDHTGKTALMHAAEKNYSSIVQLLLKVGAKTNIKNNEGRTAYDSTTDNDIKKMIKKHEDRMRDITKRMIINLPGGPDITNKIGEFFRFGSKLVRKPRKSVRKPRKSVRKPRKSVRKPRKSVRKPRKSVRKPRKSVRK